MNVVAVRRVYCIDHHMKHLSLLRHDAMMDKDNVDLQSIFVLGFKYIAPLRVSIAERDSGWTQDKESSPAEDRRSSTVSLPRHQPRWQPRTSLITVIYLTYLGKYSVYYLRHVDTWTGKRTWLVLSTIFSKTKDFSVSREPVTCTVNENGAG